MSEEFSKTFNRQGRAGSDSVSRLLAAIIKHKRGESAMKTLLLSAFILTIACSAAFAQDVIVLKNGNEIKAKVIEITPTEIKYKKFDNLQGPTVVIVKSDVFMIKYENGTKDVINAGSTTSGSEAKSASVSRSLTPDAGWSAIYFQPLGFLQFGPIIGGEVAASPNVTIGAHLRIPSLGLLSYVAAYNASDGAPDQMSGFGLGADINYFPVSARNGFYVGFVTEYISTSQLYLQGDIYEWQDKTSFFLLAANGGYKWGFPSGFFVSTGLLLGDAVPLSGKWHYTQGYDTTEKNDDLSGAVIYMLQLTVGVTL